jgi:hypothetical protein
VFEVDSIDNTTADSATSRTVASWFNRRIKTCRNIWAHDATNTSSGYAELQDTSSGTGVPLHCDFVSWMGDDLSWSLFGSIQGPTSTATSSIVSNVSAAFDATSAQSEATQWKQNSALQNYPLALSGSASLSEDHHYVTELAKSSSGGTVTVFAGGGEDLRIPQ